MTDPTRYPIIEFTVPSSDYHAFDRDVAADFGKGIAAIADENDRLAYGILADLIEAAGGVLPTGVPEFDLLIWVGQTGCDRQVLPNKRHNFRRLALGFTVDTGEI